MSLDLKQEQKRVEHVMESIEKEINRLEEETTRRKNEVVHIRKHFWEEVKVNTDTFDDFLETIIGLRQEAQALSVSQSTHRHASKRLATLRRMKEIPYFGRIDFIEEGNSSHEKIYIGISSLSDSSGEDFLIHDWRAPVSSVYYDYQPGPASYQTPGGTVYGTLEKKYQYLIRGGILQSMFDTSLTIGDEILQQVLGKGTDKQMHNIVATIQQEQNRIIRHDQGRLLIVHGAAGSGKTSAALQRIAYLLYKYRESLHADQIILFSPNSMFSNYVSNVLPELGEENMQQVTFQEYLDHRLSRAFKIETPFEQLEYVLTQANSPFYKTRLASIRFKASTSFYEVIQAYRQSLESSGMIFKDISFKGKPIVTAQQIIARFYEYEPSLRFHNRLEKLQEWLLEQIQAFQKVARKQSWVQEEIELLSNEEYHKARVYLARKRGFNREEIADYEIEPKALARLIVHKRLKPLRKQIRQLQFIDLNGIYKQLFANPEIIRQLKEEYIPPDWPSICQQTVIKLSNNLLSYEDATPFLLLKELIVGFHTNSSIKQIVIDEAQDYSPLQFEFLKRLFPAARMTVLGDFNQAIFAHASEHVDFNSLTSLYGREKTEVINMTRSYRSTKPIIEFTRRLIPNGEKITPFERDGDKPILKQVVDHVELHRCITSKVTHLRSLGFSSIAIICKSAEESSQAYQTLSGIDDLKLIKSNSSEYGQGVVVIPTYLSKGIEFEAVIIYDASEHVYGDENLRRTFYTACTRAMRFLQLYSVGEPSPFLQTVLKR
ncbi:RNA polymerase recycling motor HelD [Metabacillus malikii]|uniref:DNA helicase-2/ATP-dependent DNA helicase PcrA n=1 Tax=Metabacillus malikii TaxID=1504265 RepID=A0ABT9ZA08_9BACI|nr:RNA polymerase recycling motor HelD [Metabacillus malikii]MDQ0229094.1 DNA helicase-2/ATP-dependent DNA helicase PcrA [Metabacillus malikii]